MNAPKSYQVYNGQPYQVVNNLKKKKKSSTSPNRLNHQDEEDDKFISLLQTNMEQIRHERMLLPKLATVINDTPRMKFNFTNQEEQQFDNFVELLSKFNEQQMEEILSSVIKKAMEAKLLRNYN